MMRKMILGLCSLLCLCISGDAQSPYHPRAVIATSDAAEAPATLEVRLPSADAALCIDGELIAGSGHVRTYHTRPFDTGRTYRYTISVGGDEQTVTAHGGERVVADFCRAKAPLSNGLTAGEVFTGRERFLISGKEVSAEKAKAILSAQAHAPTCPCGCGGKCHCDDCNHGDDVPDRRGQLFVTLVSADAAQRAAFVAACQSASSLAPWKGRLLVNAYDPSDWHVANLKYPPLVIEDLGGKDLWHAQAYSGPDQLAAALRKADPSYRPDAPSPGGPGGDPSAAPPALLSRVPPLAGVAGGLGLLGLLGALGAGAAKKNGATAT